MCGLHNLCSLHTSVGDTREEVSLKMILETMSVVKGWRVSATELRDLSLGINWNIIV